jgi:1-acyl-sn-glycerol-3-phosphate acyltransferase
MSALFVWPRVNGVFPKDGTYIIMMNHSCFLDVFIFPLIPKGAYSGVTAKGNFKIPVFSTLIRRIKAIPIERKNLSSAIESINRAEEVLKEGIHIGILPEGTRTLDGNIGTMKKGGFHMAINTGTPIIPVGVEGAFNFKPKNRWWVRPGPIKINIGKAINTSANNKQNLDGLIHRVERELITLSGGTYEVK